MKSGKSSWFTLIELLVVVAIMSVLMAILLPSLKSANEMGKRIDCASKLRQIGIQTQGYINDYSTFYSAAEFSSPWRAWVTQLGPYFPSIKLANQIFVCRSCSSPYSWSPYVSSYAFNSNLAYNRP